MLNIIDFDRSSFPYEFIQFNPENNQSLNILNQISNEQAIELLENGSNQKLTEKQRETAKEALKEVEDKTIFNCLDKLSNINELNAFSLKCKSTFLPVNVSYIV